MQIAMINEIKDQENRVVLPPEGAKEVTPRSRGRAALAGARKSG